MGYSGWMIVLMLALLAVYVTPALIRTRQHQVDNPVEDRFSKGLMVVDVAAVCPRVHAEFGQTQPRLLPNTQVDNHFGEWSMEMEQGTTRPRRRVGRSAETQRQLAKIRSARRLRLANEAAAGKRRLLLVALSLIFLIGLSFGVYVGTVATAWLAAPGISLVSVLIAGRVAYQRSVEATAAESAAMEKIRREEDALRERQLRRRQRSTELVDGAVTFAGQQVTLPTAEIAQPETTVELVADVVETDVQHRATQDALVGSRAKGITVRGPKLGASAADMLDSLGAVAGTGTVSGTVSGSGSVLGKSAVVRRRTQPIHETLEAPVVAGKRRPVEARPMPASALTSAEAAETAAPSFDVDQILDLRRAQ